MKICTLSSGSKGNCTYVESGGCALLIDQGLSLRELERRALGVGLDLKKVQMVAVMLAIVVVLVVALLI